MEALHTTLIHRLKALRHTGVDRGTIIIRRYPTQPQARFLKPQRRAAAPPLITNGQYFILAIYFRDKVTRIGSLRASTDSTPLG